MTRADSAVRGQAYRWLALLRGPHSPSDEQAFEDWYAAAPAHAVAYDGLLETWRRTGLLKASGREARTAIAAWGPYPRLWARRAIAAAMGALTIGVGVLLADQAFTPGTPAQAALLETRIGEIRTLRLADGSQVTLDTDSEVVASLDRRARRLELRRGRARFEVAPDRVRPFRVVARGASIVALGTAFDVALGRDGVTVSLLAGAADIGARAAGPIYRVDAGTRLTVPAEDGRPLTRRPITPGDLRWPSGLLWFDDVSVETVVAATNRYTTQPLVATDPAVRGLRFTGIIQAQDPAGVARLLAETFHLAITRDAAGRRVLGAGAARPAAAASEKDSG